MYVECSGFIWEENGANFHHCLNKLFITSKDWWYASIHIQRKENMKNTLQNRQKNTKIKNINTKFYVKTKEKTSSTTKENLRS